MAPLRDAVGFVDDEHGNGQGLHESRKELILQSFRRDIDQLDAAGTDGSKAGLHFFKGTLAVDICRRYFLIDQTVYLVFHQGNER